MQVGSKCNKLKQGDRVLPVTAGWGKCTAWWFVNNFFVVVCNSGNDSSQGHCLQLAMKLDQEKDRQAGRQTDRGFVLTGKTV